MGATVLIPRAYQTEKAIQAVNVLKANNLVYLAMQERTGKSLVGILVVEFVKPKRCLIITKAKAKKDWDKLIDDWDSSKYFFATTYQQAYKVADQQWDIVILDEAHNYISAFPGRKHNKPTKLYSQIRDICRRKPIIYMSATPHAQGLHQLYNQLALSTWSPFSRYRTPYDWYEVYGVPATHYVNGIEYPDWTSVNDEAIKKVTDHLFVRGTRKELGFVHEPVDKVHYVDLDDKTREVYNWLLKHKTLRIQGHTMVADSTARLRSLLFMLEGGTCKLTNVLLMDFDATKIKLPHAVLSRPGGMVCDILVDLNLTSKVDYILKHWGDNKDVVIFYNFIAEKFMLERRFKHATILQGTAYAEGVDLSHIRHLIVFSQDFSTARYTQRRARQASMSRDSDIVIHFLLTKKGVSEQTYKTVAINKKNFVDSVFDQEEI